MRYGFSFDRISNLSRLIIDELYNDDSVEVFVENYILRKNIIEAIESEFDFYEELKEKAREKIVNQKRNIIEGSREWDLLLKKYFYQELDKLDKISD